MAPNQPSQSSYARSTRVTRSQTREPSDSEAGRLGTKTVRARPKKNAKTNSMDVAPQIQRSKENAPNTSTRAGPLGDVPEVDEHSRISYPELPQAVVDADELTTSQVGDAQRKSIQNVRSSGDTSVFSGTTARTSRSVQEPSNIIAAGDLIDSLEDLSTRSDKILHLSIPQEVSEDTVQSTRDRLSDPESREGRLYRRHRDVYDSLRKDYGDSKYIPAEAIVKALPDKPSYAHDSLSSWRVDPVLYKANLVELVMASVSQPDGDFENSMTELDQVYPRPFLHQFVDAPNVGRSPDSSALRMDTFHLALDIRTYSFVESAKRSRDGPDFDPDELLQRLFYRSSNTLSGWDVAGIRSDNYRQNPRLKNDILHRLDQIRGTFLAGEGYHIDVGSLERQFSRAWLTTRLIHWCRLRFQEIETQLKALEGVSGIVHALESRTTGDEKLSPTDHGRPTAAGHRSYGFHSPQALKSAIPRLKELEARRVSRDLEKSSVIATGAKLSRPGLPSTAGANTPAQTANTLPKPASAPARVHDRHLSPSHLAPADQMPPIDDDDNAIILNDTSNTKPSETVEELLQLDVEANKATLEMQPSPPKKRRFIDPQENAEQVEFDDIQDTAPASTSIAEAKRIPSPAEESVSEDGGFQTDRRSMAHRTVRSTNTSRKGPAQSSRARRVRIVPPSRNIAEPNEIGNIVARYNDANAPALSQMETYSLANEDAKRAVRKLPKQPQTRTFWSEDETARLLELIQTSGTSWALLLKMDADYEGGALFQSRDSNALKDKANNMKMDYLK
ncbi:MAG: hypothetical protein LQ352_002897 [Teloschistes flavicans]|nr:MAG: hypothetical protein LQ352_002897 [Teloschistes flavicans]